MVTEFSVHTNDVTQRAQSLKEALYVYFSNPQVAGVVLWHFSDQDGITMGDDMPLFEGPDFKVTSDYHIIIIIIIILAIFSGGWSQTHSVSYLMIADVCLCVCLHIMKMPNALL